MCLLNKGMHVLYNISQFQIHIKQFHHLCPIVSMHKQMQKAWNFITGTRKSKNSTLKSRFHLWYEDNPHSHILKLGMLNANFSWNDSKHFHAFCGSLNTCSYTLTLSSWIYFTFPTTAAGSRWGCWCSSWPCDLWWPTWNKYVCSPWDAPRGGHLVQIMSGKTLGNHLRFRGKLPLTKHERGMSGCVIYHFIGREKRPWSAVPKHMVRIICK